MRATERASQPVRLYLKELSSGATYVFPVDKKLYVDDNGLIGSSSVTPLFFIRSRVSGEFHDETTKEVKKLEVGKPVEVRGKRYELRTEESEARALRESIDSVLPSSSDLLSSPERSSPFPSNSLHPTEALLDKIRQILAKNSQKSISAEDALALILDVTHSDVARIVTSPRHSRGRSPLSGSPRKSLNMAHLSSANLFSKSQSLPPSNLGRTRKYISKDAIAYRQTKRLGLPSRTKRNGSDFQIYNDDAEDSYVGARVRRSRRVQWPKLDNVTLIPSSPPSAQDTERLQGEFSRIITTLTSHSEASRFGPFHLSMGKNGKLSLQMVQAKVEERHYSNKEDFHMDMMTLFVHCKEYYSQYSGDYLSGAVLSALYIDMIDDWLIKRS